MIDSPAALREALCVVAGNLSFSWLPGARALFAELDPERFAALHHNPTALLAVISDKDLAPRDDGHGRARARHRRARAGARAGVACPGRAHTALPARHRRGGEPGLGP